MSHAPVLEAAGPATSLNGSSPSANGEASPSMEAKIAWAKDVIAGRVPRPTLPQHPEVDAWVRREFAKFNPPPSESAFRDISQRLTLQAEYNGVPVACLYTKDGTYPVLAVGTQEIFALFDALAAHERSRVIITDTVE